MIIAKGLSKTVCAEMLAAYAERLKITKPLPADLSKLRTAPVANLADTSFKDVCCNGRVSSAAA